MTPTRRAPRGVRRSTPRSTTRRGRARSERLEVERPLFRALPAARPAVACGEERKVDRLATVRFVSARYSVPHRLVGEIVQVPGLRSRRRDHAPRAFRSLSTRCWRPGRRRSSTRTTRHRRRPASARCGRARARSTRSWRWAPRRRTTCGLLRRPAPPGCTSAWTRRSASRARAAAIRRWRRSIARRRFGRFAHGDLALDRRRAHRTTPPTAVADAEPLHARGAADGRGPLAG